MQRKQTIETVIQLERERKMEGGEREWGTDRSLQTDRYRANGGGREKGRNMEYGERESDAES